MFNFQFFKKKEDASEQTPTVFPLLERLHREYQEKKEKTKYEDIQLKQLPSHEAIALLSEEDKKQLFLLATKGRIESLEKMEANWSNNTYHLDHGFYHIVTHFLAKFRLSYSEENLLALAMLFHLHFHIYDDRTYRIVDIAKMITNKLKERIEDHKASMNTRTALLYLHSKKPNSSEEKKLNELILFLTQESNLLKVNEHDILGKAILSYLKKETEKGREQLEHLLNFFQSAEDKASPTQKWLTETKKITESVGSDVLTQFYHHLLNICIDEIKNIHKKVSTTQTYTPVQFLTDNNHQLLKGLIWSCCHLGISPETIDLLDDYASWAYKKIPGHGPVSARTGNACMLVFGKLPTVEAIARLTKFKQKIKNNTVLAQIEKQIRLLAEANQMTVDDMEEMAVSTHGFAVDGVLQVPFGETLSVTHITPRWEIETTWQWQGKTQKSVPASIKESHKEELALFKKQLKNIESSLQTQKTRIETLFLKNKKWTYADWATYYNEHPFLQHLSRSLIWNFTDPDNETVQAFHTNEGAVNALGFPVHIDKQQTSVSLWHPIQSPAEDVLAWRSFLFEHEILQPFKQAYREIYLVTDAELNTGTYSNRFAAHILRQHQMAALCRQRGWHYTLQGNWDSFNYPTVHLKNWNIKVDFFLEADWNGEANEMGIFSYVLTDQVRFYEHNVQLKMEEVPPMVFTELMRDIDLFVGVCSVGNDPYWSDQGNQRINTYWSDYSRSDLTESAKMREQALKNLIPRMKIANLCSFDGKYILVKGKLRTYKVHIGSGNILMQPNDQYLCIVPDRTQKSAEKVFLPFEGDSLLSVILSKVLLLTEDDKIKDPSITRQLGVSQ